MRLSAITFFLLWLLCDCATSEDILEPPICTKSGLLNVMNNIDKTSKTIIVPSLKFKTLVELRALLDEHELFPASSVFQIPLHLKEVNELQFSSISSKSEGSLKACDILRCNLQQCTVFITSGNTVSTTTAKPDCSSASNGLISIHNIREKHSNEIRVPDLGSKTLADLRVLLQKKSFFSMDNKFRKHLRTAQEFSIITAEAEADIKACDIISCIDNECTLHVGQDGLKSNQINIDRFLRSMTIDKSGVWSMTTLKVAEFDDNYNVDYKKPLTEVSYVTKTSSSLREHYRNKEGVTEASISFHSPFVSGSVSYESSYSSSDRTGDEKTYFIVRVLHNKLDVHLKYDKLVLVKGFVDEMFNVIDSRDFEYQKALDLIDLLNRYGWYFPVKYTLGGSFRNDVRTSKMSNEKASMAATSFKAELQASFFGFGGGVGGGHSNKNKKSDKYIDESTFTEVSSVGAGGATSIEEYLNNIKVEDNWSIVQYDEFVPTILLLRRYYSGALNEIIKIFRRVYFDQRIKAIQPNINIQKYITNIQEQITPVWS